MSPIPRKWLLLPLLILAITGLSWLWAGVTTGKAILAVQERDLIAASRWASWGLPVLRDWSFITRHVQPEIEVWQAGLTLISEVPPQLREITQRLDLTRLTPAEQQTAPTLKQLVSPWLAQVAIIERFINQSWLLPAMLSTDEAQALDTLLPLATALDSTILDGEQTWVVVFQNSQELRATGGFTGSLAFVRLKDGSITQIEIQDIYQPDGQFSGYLEPPAGVAQYLSGGKSWRLPDLNWSPDFPQTGHQITQYLQSAGYPPVAGVVSVNLEVAAELLKVTGDIYLPDSRTTVTPHNLAEVLRQDRAEFFPGSTAKQQTLSQFFTLFKLQLSQLEPQQQLAVLKVLGQAAGNKQIQVYATDSVLESALKQAQLAGQVPQSNNASFYMLPIESNVGINKANQGVNRSYDVKIGETTSQVVINWMNTNASPSAVPTKAAQANHLHYVNYQRFWLLPETTISSLTYNGQPITQWDEQLVTSSQGEVFKQIGFLVTVREKSDGQLQLTFSHPPVTSPSRVVIGKQSGPVSIPLNLDLAGTYFTYNLQRDLIVTAPQTVAQ